MGNCRDVGGIDSDAGRAQAPAPAQAAPKVWQTKKKAEAETRAPVGMRWYICQQVWVSCPASWTYRSALGPCTAPLCAPRASMPGTKQTRWSNLCFTPNLRGGREGKEEGPQ
jgi:hypothetical protein